MIEPFWRSLRHTWLYLHNPDNTATLRHLIEFYVRDHSETIPHAALNGQTPEEMYFGNGDAVVIDLAAAIISAVAAVGPKATATPLARTAGVPSAL